MRLKTRVFAGFVGLLSGTLHALPARAAGTSVVAFAAPGNGQAGLAVGFLQSCEEIASLWQVDRRFEPQMRETERDQLYRGWQDAVNATMGFRVD